MFGSQRLDPRGPQMRPGRIQRRVVVDMHGHGVSSVHPFVMAGLDPAVHPVTVIPLTAGRSAGHDERGVPRCVADRRRDGDQDRRIGGDRRQPLHPAAGDARGDPADRLAAAAFRRRRRPPAHEHPQLRGGNADAAHRRRYLPWQRQAEPADSRHGTISTGPFLDDLAAAGYPPANRSTLCCARICTWTMSAGTRCWSMADGCRRSRVPAT